MGSPAQLYIGYYVISAYLLAQVIRADAAEKLMAKPPLWNGNFTSKPGLPVSVGLLHDG